LRYYYSAGKATQNMFEHNRHSQRNGANCRLLLGRRGLKNEKQINLKTSFCSYLLLHW